MNKIITRLLNTVLSITLLIFIFVFIMATKLQGEQSRFLFSVLPGIQVFLGVVASYFSIRITKKAYQLFLSLLFSFCGILQLLMLNQVLPFTLSQGWPLIGLIAGIVMFISGYVKYRKIKFGYFLPSIILVILSFWYMLFSFKIVKWTFSFVVSSLGPIFVVSIVLLLVVFFFLQQRHKELIVKDEETGVFSDEDMI